MMETPQDPQARSVERLFLEQLARAYTPPPLSAAERAAFEVRLRARLERAQRPGPWVPVAGAVAVAAALWVGFDLQRAAAPLPPSSAVGVAVLLAAALEDEPTLERSALPESYLLLDGLIDEPADEPAGVPAVWGTR
jgi:hypothetical protein